MTRPDDRGVETNVSEPTEDSAATQDADQPEKTQQRDKAVTGPDVVPTVEPE